MCKEKRHFSEWINGGRLLKNEYIFSHICVFDNENMNAKLGTLTWVYAKASTLFNHFFIRKRELVLH